MKNLKIVFIATLSIALFSCEPEDGIDGVNGIDGIEGTAGIDGIDGSDGSNGIDGENGEGFDLLTQFGGINLNVSGTRADGKSIDAQPLEFIYSDFDGDSIGPDNFIETVDNITSFEIERELDPEHASSVFMEFTLNNETSEVVITSLFFDDVIVMSSDLVFFQIDNTFEDYVSQSVTNFSFDEATKALAFDFEVVVNTGIAEVTSDLTLVGSVNVLMPQEVEVTPAVLEL